MKSSTYQQQYRQRGLSTRKLFLLSSLVFVSAIAVSATSTYAFYSLNEKFFIAGLGFRMEIKHDATFKLGTKDGSGEIRYKEDSYSLADFGYTNPTLGNTSNMFHTLEYPSSYQETFTPYFYDGYHLGGSRTKTNQVTKETEDGIVQMEFYVFCSEDAYIYLAEGSVASADRDANQRVANGDTEKLRHLNDVTKAARMSFYSPYGYVIAELDEEPEELGKREQKQVSYAGKLDLGGDGYFDADADGKEILFGSYEGNVAHQANPIEEDIAIYSQEDIFHAKSRAGNYLIDASASTYVEEKEVANPLEYYTYHDAYRQGHPVAVAKAKTPTRMVISIYLEGWDYDMTSDLILASFGFELGFVAVFDPASADATYKIS